jgi:hypothetical protein
MGLAGKGLLPTLVSGRLGGAQAFAPIFALEIDKARGNFYSAPQLSRLLTTEGEMSYATAYQQRLRRHTGQGL